MCPAYKLPQSGRIESRALIRLLPRLRRDREVEEGSYADGDQLSGDCTRKFFEKLDCERPDVF